MARAMTDQAKKEKSNYILDKAFELFETKSFKEFRMSDLAKLADMSKGLLFNYFRSKEMLFMSMLDRQHDYMMETIRDDFSQYDEIDTQVIKKVFLKETETLYHPSTPLIKLNLIKSTILEQNIDYDFAVNQKLSFIKKSQELYQEIISRLKDVSPEEFMKVFTVHVTLLFGYLHQVTTSSVIKQVLKDYNLTQFEIDPIKETKESLKIFIDGYLGHKKESS